MNRTSMRALLLGAMLVAMLATMASSAGASMWNSTGGSFSGTGGASTLDSGNTALACNVATLTGTFTGTTGPTLPTAWAAVTGTKRFTSCTPVGFTVHCVYTLVATSTTAATDISGTTTGVAVVHCIVYVGGVTCRTISGSLAGTYHNPPVTTGTTRMTLASSNLTVSAFGAVNCALATGPARFTGNTYHIPAGTAPSVWAS